MYFRIAHNSIHDKTHDSNPTYATFDTVKSVEKTVYSLKNNNHTGRKQQGRSCNAIASVVLVHTSIQGD